VSVLTAVHPPSARFVAEACRSVRALELPAGWEVEWVVQEDGAEGRLAGLAGAGPWVRYECNGAALGAGATRNLALRRCAGDLVQVLDHDDLLLPGALAALVPAFDRDDIHWAAGRADDLMPDGSRVPFPPDLPPGRVEPGAVNAAAARTGRFPVHCAGLMLRTTTLRACGGWVATPRSEDVAMLAALSEVVAGWFVPEVTWLYRRWPGQTRRGDDWREREEQGAAIVAQRVAAVRALWRALGGRPDPG
jgi:hypothetical protein